MTDAFYRALKITSMIVVATALSVAIFDLIAVLTPMVLPDVFDEVIGLISVFAPFDCFQVFGAMSIAMSVIGGFIGACKIFNLNVKVVGGA